MTLPKTMGFKTFLNVDYAPGQDPLIKKNAKKRKGADVDSGVVESMYVKTSPGHLTRTAEKIGAKYDADKKAYFKGSIQIGHLAPKTNKPSASGQSGMQMHQHYIHKSLKESEEVDHSIDEAVLNTQQRRLRSLQMKRMAPRIRLGQERAKSRFADLGRLKKRATKAARTMVFRKLTKGIPKDELTFQRRAEIEKRLDTPAMKARIERIAIKMLPKEREAEVARHRPKPAEGSQQ